MYCICFNSTAPYSVQTYLSHLPDLLEKVSRALRHRECDQQEILTNLCNKSYFDVIKQPAIRTTLGKVPDVTGM